MYLKRTSFCMFFSFLCSCTMFLSHFANAEAPRDAAGDSLLSYRFEEMHNDRVKDTSGHDRSGKTHNTDVADGRSGNALSFNGISSYVVTEHTAGLEFPQDDFTVEVWFNPTTGDGTLLSMPSNTSSTYGRYQLLLDKGNPRIVVRRPAGPSPYLSMRTDIPVQLERWNYLAATFDSARGKITLFLNGSRVESTAWEGETLGTPKQPLYLGAHARAKAYPSFKGLIDEVRISDSVLSPGEIHARWVGPLKETKAQSNWAHTDVLGFVVPPVTSTKWLPHVLPPEKNINSEINVIGAKGTFEPASFILYPFEDIEELEIEWSGLTGQDKGAAISREELNVRLVKRWYQSGNAWDGYPLQNTSRRVFVPELLLNDQNLVKVDRDNEENYLRIDYPEGKKYVWISYPEEGEHNEPFRIPHRGPVEFNHFAEPVYDAATLQPVRLKEGEAKQFWVTVYLPDNVPADTYSGKITLNADGQASGEFTLNATVLPFELPMPKTYYDTAKDYHVVLWHQSRTITHKGFYSQAGFDDAQERTENRLKVEFQNMLDHNAFHPRGPFYPQPDADAFLTELRIRQEVGLPLDPIIGGTHAVLDRWWDMPEDEEGYQERFEKFTERIDRTFSMIEEVTGHRNIFFDAIDEGKERRIKLQQDAWKHIQEEGGKVWATGWHVNFPMAGHAQNFHSWAGKPTRERAQKWHSTGGRIGSYAYPFSGPEDPLLWRRNQGLLHYKANYDASGVYAYSEGRLNIWNDFIETNTYRSFCMVYPTKDGVIDTIAWEGFREGIDDIRYATLMKLLAEEAIASGCIDARYEGRKALVWLELMDEENANLDTVRMELINNILNLQNVIDNGA